MGESETCVITLTMCLCVMIVNPLIILIKYKTFAILEFSSAARVTQLKDQWQ